MAGQLDSRGPLERWMQIVEDAAWRNTAEIKQAFGANVDFVRVKSGRTICVFDIGGNKYRLVAAVHFWRLNFARAPVYVLRVMDHGEYDQQAWIKEL
jgi:mRNA interferase HigB